MRRITPFLRGRTWWARVPRINAEAIQRSLGVEDASEAEEMCRFLEWLRGRGARSEYLLGEIAAARVTVLAPYTAYVNARLDAFEQQLRDGANDPDLEPYVARWIKELERRKKPNARTRHKYEQQTRTLLAAGTPFRRSAFTKQRIRTWLSELPVAQPNRYRAALSSFAQYLVFEDVLPANPVRQVPMAAEREPRTTHLSPADALRLIDALDQPYQALHALMAATGMELGAALALRRRDVDVAQQTVFARGTKRAHRQRTVTVYGTWNEMWLRFSEWLADRALLPDAAPFSGVTPWGAYRALKVALKATSLDSSYRVHDHRHTWAVQAVRDGLALHTIAHQLGHRDATMVLKVYGRFVPTAADFTRNPPSTATAPVDKRAGPRAV